MQKRFRPRIFWSFFFFLTLFKATKPLKLELPSCLLVVTPRPESTSLWCGRSMLNIGWSPEIAWSVEESIFDVLHSPLALQEESRLCEGGVMNEFVSGNREMLSRDCLAIVFIVWSFANRGELRNAEVQFFALPPGSVKISFARKVESIRNQQKTLLWNRMTRFAFFNSTLDIHWKLYNVYYMCPCVFIDWYSSMCIYLIRASMIHVTLLYQNECPSGITFSDLLSL